MILIYITCKDKKQADAIGMHLMKKRLIACTNTFPIESRYWWKGKITVSKEYVLIGKTRDSNYDVIVKEVTKVHSYDVPCIMKIDVEANKSYEDWLMKETRRV